MRRCGALLFVFALPVIGAAQQPQAPVLRAPDVIFVATQDPVAEAMLKLASVTKDDVVYDLGSGDGKIVITAAQRFGARGVGIDINPQRIEEANRNAETAGVSDRVTFILGDIFDPAIPISDATVVTLYLLPTLNQKLMPRLKQELAPGTRVVSNSFDMGPTWPAERTEQVGTYWIYMWTIPER
jgi:SAM-dependent methyltransferase